MAINIIYKCQRIIVFGFSFILAIIICCLVYQSHQQITVFLDEQNECIIAYQDGHYFQCADLKSTNFHYMIHHYRLFRFTKDKNEIKE